MENIFQSYPWYGNVRELKNIIKRAALLSDGSIVQLKALPFEIVNHEKLAFGVHEIEPEIFKESTPVQAANPVIAGNLMNTNPLPSTQPFNLKSAAQEAEYDAIMQTLQRAKYNKSKAAELLGIDRKTLYNKLKKFGIE